MKKVARIILGSDELSKEELAELVKTVIEDLSRMECVVKGKVRIEQEGEVELR